MFQKCSLYTQICPPVAPARILVYSKDFKKKRDKKDVCETPLICPIGQQGYIFIRKNSIVAFCDFCAELIAAVAVTVIIVFPNPKSMDDATET